MTSEWLLSGDDWWGRFIGNDMQLLVYKPYATWKATFAINDGAPTIVLNGISTAELAKQMIESAVLEWNAKRYTEITQALGNPKSVSPAYW